MTTKTIKVKLKVSPIAMKKDQIATIKGLGLRRVGHTKELENTSSVRGMVKKMLFALDILK
jgi:large subunit ribosomal protein L30